MVYIMATVYYL